MKYYLLLPVVISLLSSCASGPTRVEKSNAFEPPRYGMAKLVFYRPPAFTGGGAFPDIKINDKKVGVLKNGKIFTTEVSPGSHKIDFTGLMWWNIRTNSLVVQAQPNHTTYIRLAQTKSTYTGTVVPTNFSSYAEEIIPEYAIREIQSLSIR